MIRRRALVTAACAWLAARASNGFAQSPRRNRVVFLLPGRESGFRPLVLAFRRALGNLGYVEGRDVLLEFYWAEDRTEDLPRLATKIVAGKPDVIVTATSAALAACKAATSTIPIIFATVADPVEQGFVQTLQRPGGNVTGVLVFGDLTQKLLEVSREAFPKARRFALLVHETDPIHRIVLEGYSTNAARLKLEPLIVRVQRTEDLDRAFSELVGRRADVLLLPQLAFMTSHHAQLIERSVKARLPLVSGQIFFAERGGLLSYGARVEENYERAAAMVDRILRGATPAEIAVEQPQRFHLVVNRKTAQSIGAEVSSLTMLRADRVIE